MLTYLGSPLNIENEFNIRDIQKPSNDVLNLYDVDGGVTLNKVDLYGNTTIWGNFKSDSSNITGFSRTFPLLSLSNSSIFNANNVSISSNNNIPAIISIPFWNSLRGDGKGFSVDLGLYPVRLKVFQDATNGKTNRFTISTTGNKASAVRQTIGYDVDGATLTNQTLANDALALKVVADKSFTAKYLGAWINIANGNTQMAIYNSIGTLLSRTSTKVSGVTGKQLYTLNSKVTISSGETYYILISCSGAMRTKKTTPTSDTVYKQGVGVPIPNTNQTFTTTTGTAHCYFVENDWDDDPYEENNSFNIWANGMVSIGNTLNTATLGASVSTGDVELNPGSLLVQNDINVGTTGAKADSLARLHVKASTSEYTAKRNVALFQLGDGTNSTAIGKEGDFVSTKPGSGIILRDTTNGNFYKISINNGTVVLTQWFGY